MNYLKRIVLVTLIFFVLLFLFSMFLPSSFLLENKVFIDNDRYTIEKEIDQINFENFLNYTSNAEDIIWDFNENQERTELKAALTLNFGFNPIMKFKALFNKQELINEFILLTEKLKSKVEDQPKIHHVKVDKKYLGDVQWYVSIRDTVNQQEASNIHGKLLAQINQYMDNNELKTEAFPIIIYHLWSDTIVDIEAGIPVTDSIMVKDDTIKLKKINPGNVATAIHYGPYDRLPETYFGINEWMRRNKVIVTGAPWEVYLTNPVEENNPEKWQTAIYFPIE